MEKDTKIIRGEDGSLEGQTKSPIYVLPPELLTIIHNMVYDLSDQPKMKHRCRISLSHISRFWREVAIANSYLWSEINLSTPWPATLLPALLERSGQSLLDVSIRINYPEPTSRYSNFGKYLSIPVVENLISRQFHRCRRISVRGRFVIENTRRFLDRFLHTLQRIEMPCLEQLEVIVHEYYSYSSSNPIPNLFPASADKLSSIRIGGFPFQLDNSSGPLARMTTMHLVVCPQADGIPLTTFTHMLNSCPCLELLVIYDSFLEEITHSQFLVSSGTTVVPSLQSLFLVGIGIHSISEILIFLTAPRLQELVISPMDISDLDLLIRTSKQFPSLKSFTVGVMTPNYFSVLPRISLCFSQLSRLVLTVMYHHKFLENFRNHPNIFPNLIELAVTGVEEDFLDVVSGHLPPGLKKVYLDTPSMEKFRAANKKESDYPFAIEEANIWEEQRLTLEYKEDKRRFTTV